MSFMMFAPFIKNNGLRYSNQKGFTLVKYKKPLNDFSLGLYRSVIYKDDKLVCFSPPNSVPFNMFVENHPDYRIEEFVEGTMINLFFYTHWHVCTKSVIGATCTFFDDAPTFLDMFNEAFSSYNLLDPSYVYSFVLKHPLNRIVDACPAEVVLVAMYSITDNVVSEVPLDTRFATPRQYKTVPTHFCKGVMFRANGQRSKQRNPEYKLASDLGNFSNPRVRDITTWQTDRLALFLTYYPDLVEEVNRTISCILNFANVLLKTYKRRYIYRKDCPTDLIPYTFELQQIYYIIRPQRVSLDTVLSYLKSVSAQRLFNTIYYGAVVKRD